MERSTDDSMEVDRAITNQNGQSLGGGRYITTTDVGAIFELGNDIAAMEKIQNVTEIKKIYRNGNSGESIEIGDDG